MHGVQGLVEDDLEVCQFGVHVVVHFARMDAASSVALVRIWSACSSAIRTISDCETITFCSSLASARMRSASARPSSMTVSRSRSNCSACASSSGSSAHLVEQRQYLAAIDDAGCRHGHGTRAFDLRDELVELLVDVHSRVCQMGSDSALSADRCVSRSTRRGRTFSGSR